MATFTNTGSSSTSPINYVMNFQTNTPIPFIINPNVGIYKCSSTIASIISGQYVIDSTVNFTSSSGITNFPQGSSTTQITDTWTGTDGTTITYNSVTSGNTITYGEISFSSTGYYITMGSNVEGTYVYILCIVGDIPTIETDYGLNPTSTTTFPFFNNYLFTKAQVNGKDYMFPSTYTDLSTSNLSLFLTQNPSNCSLTLNNYLGNSLCLEIYLSLFTTATSPKYPFTIKLKYNFVIDKRFYNSSNTLTATSQYNGINLLTATQGTSSTVGFPFYTNVSSYITSIQGNDFTPVSGFYNNTGFLNNNCCRCIPTQISLQLPNISVGYGSSTNLNSYLPFTSVILGITMNSAAGNYNQTPLVYSNGIINLQSTSGFPTLYVDTNGILYSVSNSSATTLTYNTFVIHTNLGSFNYTLSIGQTSLETVNDTIYLNECTLQINIQGDFTSGYDDTRFINSGEISSGIYTTTVNCSKKITIVSTTRNYVCTIIYNEYCQPITTASCVVINQTSSSLKYYYPTGTSNIAFQSNLIVGTVTTSPNTQITIGDLVYNTNFLAWNTINLTVNANSFSNFQNFLPKGNYITTASLNSAVMQVSVPSSSGLITDNFGLYLTQTGTYILALTLSSNGYLVFNITVAPSQLPTYSISLYAQEGDFINAPDNSVETITSITYKNQTYTSFLGQTIGDLTFSLILINGMLQVSSTKTTSFVITGSSATYNISLMIIPDLVIPNITMAIGSNLDFVTTYVNPLYQTYYKSKTFVSSSSSLVSLTGTTVQAVSISSTGVSITLNNTIITTITVVPAQSTSIITCDINASYNTEFSDNIWNYILANGSKQLLSVTIDNTVYPLPLNLTTPIFTMNDTGNFKCTLLEGLPITVDFIFNSIVETETINIDIILGSVIKIPIMAKSSNTVLSQLSNYTIQKVQTNNINYTPNQNIIYNTATYFISTNTLDIGNETSFPLMNITATLNGASYTLSVEISVMPVITFNNQVVVAETSQCTITLPDSVSYAFNNASQTFNPIYNFQITSQPTVIPVVASYCGNIYNFSIYGFKGTSTNYGILQTRTISNLGVIQSYYGATGSILTSDGTIVYKTATIQVIVSTGTIIVNAGSETSIPNFIYQSGNSYYCLGLQVLPVNTIPSQIISVSNIVQLPLGPTYVSPTYTISDSNYTASVNNNVITFVPLPVSAVTVNYTYGSSTIQNVNVVFTSGKSYTNYVIDSITVSPVVNPSTFSINGTNYTAPNSIQVDGTVYTVSTSTITVTPSTNYVAPVLISDNNSYYEYEFIVVPSYTWVDIVEPRNYIAPFLITLPIVNTAVYTTSTSGCAIIGNILTVSTNGLNSCSISVEYAETTQTFIIHFTANNLVQLNVVQGNTSSTGTSISISNMLESLPNINGTVITNYIYNGVKFLVSSLTSDIQLANNCVISFTSTAISIVNPLPQIDTIQFYIGNVLCLLQINILQIPIPATPLNVIGFSTVYTLTLPIGGVFANSITPTQLSLTVPSSGVFSYTYYGYQSPQIPYSITQGLPPAGISQSLLYAKGAYEKLNIINDFTTANSLGAIAQVSGITILGSTSEQNVSYTVAQTGITGIQTIDIYGNCTFDTSETGITKIQFTITAGGGSFSVNITLTIYDPSQIPSYTIPVTIGVPNTTTISLSSTAATFVSLKDGKSVYSNQVIAIPLGTIDTSSFPQIVTTTTTAGTAGAYLLTTSDGEMFYINIISFSTKALASLTISTASNITARGNLMRLLFGDKVYQEIIALGISNVFQPPSATSFVKTVSSGSGTVTIDNSFNYVYQGDGNVVYTLTYQFTGTKPTTLPSCTIAFNVVPAPQWNEITYTVPINVVQQPDVLLNFLSNDTLPIQIVSYDGQPVPYAGPSNIVSSANSLGSIHIQASGSIVWKFTAVGTETHTLVFTDGYNTVNNGIFNIVTYDPSITTSVTLVTAGQPVSYTSTSSSVSIMSYSINGVNYNLQTVQETCGTFSPIPLQTNPPPVPPVGVGVFTYTPANNFQGEIDPVLLHLSNNQSILLNFTIVNINAGSLQTVDIAQSYGTAVNLLNVFFTPSQINTLTKASLSPSYASITYNNISPASAANLTVSNYGTVNIASTTGVATFNSTVSGNWPLLTVNFNMGTTDAITSFALQITAMKYISVLPQEEFVPINTQYKIDTSSYLLIPPTNISYVSINGQNFPYNDSYITCNDSGTITISSVAVQSVPSPATQTYTISVTNGIQPAQFDVDITFYDPSTTTIYPLVVISGVPTVFNLSSVNLANAPITQIGNYKYPPSNPITVNGAIISVDAIGTMTVTATNVTATIPFTLASKIMPTVYLDLTISSGSASGQITVQSTNYNGSLFTGLTGMYTVNNFTVNGAQYQVGVQQAINGMNILINTDGSYQIYALGTNGATSAFTIIVNYTNTQTNTAYKYNIQIDALMSTSFNIYAGLNITQNLFTALGISNSSTYSILGYSIDGINYNLSELYTYSGISFSVAPNGTIDISSQADVSGANITFVVATTNSMSSPPTTTLLEFNLVGQALPQSINRTVAIPRYSPIALDFSQIFTGITGITSLQFYGIIIKVPSSGSVAVDLIGDYTIQAKMSLAGTTAIFTPNSGKDTICINPISLNCTTSTAPVTHYISIVFTNDIPSVLIPVNGVVNNPFAIVYLELTNGNTTIISNSSNILTTVNAKYTSNGNALNVQSLLNVGSQVNDIIQAICSDSTYDYRLYNFNVLTGFTLLTNTISIQSNTQVIINIPAIFAMAQPFSVSSSVYSFGVKNVNNYGIATVKTSKNQSIYIVGATYVLYLNINVN